MEEEEIEMIIDAFVRAAKIAVDEAGYDGVMLHAAHGYLIQQFFSPLINYDRTDKWGGPDLANRARFFLEVAKRVKEAVGDRAAVAARFTYDECLGPIGTTPEEALEIVKMVDRYIDFWDVDIGNYETLDEMIAPSSRHVEGWQVWRNMEWIKKCKVAGIKTPFGTCGRINSPDLAVKLRKEGLDMVGLVRPSIADPHWPRKVREGRLDEIRECIGCNTCVAYLFKRTTGLNCIQNPAAGLEWLGYDPEAEYPKVKEPKRILLVGGGPCGLEFARVAGARGHEVHLHDKMPMLGGQMRYITSQILSRREWIKVVEWRERVIRKKYPNVKIYTNSEMTAEKIAKYGADVVVFATGTLWDKMGRNPVTKRPIPGWDKPFVLTPEDIFIHGKKVGNKVLVIESCGSWIGPWLAVDLAFKGHEVYLQTFPLPIESSVLNDLASRLELGTLDALLKTSGVKLVEPFTYPAEITEDGVKIKAFFFEAWKAAVPIYTKWFPDPIYRLKIKDWEQVIKVDTVILCTMRVPQIELYEKVKGMWKRGEIPGLKGAYLTGEALTPRSWYELPYPMFWAHKLGKEI
jgi:dimethylamine/trimethylamine dehydrogenase